MRRTLSVLALISGMLTAPGLAASQQATPMSATGVLDLPAMVLQAGDIDVPGLAQGRAAFVTIDTMASANEFWMGVPAAESAATMRDDGFQMRYALDLERPVDAAGAAPAAGDLPLGLRITTSVTSYDTAEGAAASFQTFERDLEDQSGLEDLPVDQIGDETDLTLYTSEATDTGAPYQSLNLTFRLGNLIADAQIVDFSNQMPETAQIVEIGETLKARIERTLAGGAPGLSNEVIRLDTAGDFDGYIRLDGESFPGYGDSAGVIARQSRSDAGKTNIYYVAQTPGNDVYLVTMLSQFPDEAAAAAFMAGDPSTAMTDYNPRYVGVSEVTTNGAGDARVYRYAYRVTENDVVYGFVVFDHSGAVVSRVQADSPDGVLLEAVQTLSDTQQDCLEAQDCATLPEAPDFGQAPAATPEAA